MKLLKRFESFSSGHNIPTIKEIFDMAKDRKVILSSADYPLFNYIDRNGTWKAGYVYEDILSDEPVCSESDIQTLGHPSLNITWARIRINNFAFILFFQDGEPYAVAGINLRIKVGQYMYFTSESGERVRDNLDDYGYFILFEDIICVFPSDKSYLDKSITHINLMSDRASTTTSSVDYNRNLTFEEEGGEYKFTFSNSWGNAFTFKCEARSTGKIHTYRIENSKSAFNLLTNPSVSNSTWTEFDIPAFENFYPRILSGKIGVSSEDLENIIKGKSLDPKSYKPGNLRVILGCKLWSGKNIKPIDDERHSIFFEIGNTIGPVSTYDGREVGFFFGLYENKILKSLVYVNDVGGFFKTFGIMVVVSAWTERYEFTTISLNDYKPVNHYEEYYDEEEINFEHGGVQFKFDTYYGILTSTNESGQTESFDMNNLSWDKMTKPSR